MHKKRGRFRPRGFLLPSLASFQNLHIFYHTIHIFAYLIHSLSTNGSVIGRDNAPVCGFNLAFLCYHCFRPERRLDTQFVDRRHETAQVVAQHLAQDLVVLRGRALGA